MWKKLREDVDDVSACGEMWMQLTNFGGAHKQLQYSQASIDA